MASLLSLPEFATISMARSGAAVSRSPTTYHSSGSTPRSSGCCFTVHEPQAFRSIPASSAHASNSRPNNDLMRS
jgi:hypothetical protein